MARIFFQRASGGFRTVQGEVIKQLQQALISGGFLHDKDDGVLGGNTEAAVRSFQQPTSGHRQSGRSDVAEVDVFSGSRPEAALVAAHSRL